MELTVAACDGNGSVIRMAGDGIGPAFDHWNRLEDLYIFGINHASLAVYTAGDNPCLTDPRDIERFGFEPDIAHHSANSGLPKTDGAISGSRGDHRHADGDGANRHCINRLGVLVQTANQLPRFPIPDANRLIMAGSHQFSIIENAG